MKLANLDVRKRAKEAGVYHWQIAKKMGVSEITMCRKMRTELPLEEKEKIFKIIEELKGEEE